MPVIVCLCIYLIENIKKLHCAEHAWVFPCHYSLDNILLHLLPQHLHYIWFYEKSKDDLKVYESDVCRFYANIISFYIRDLSV
jgi:hypothetical protein